MDADEHTKLIRQILNPNPQNAVNILGDLGLAGLPSREQLHDEIEGKLLLAQDRLPDHWLPAYQMYGKSSHNFVHSIHFFV
jgi:antiviral helicase SKI2